MPSAVTAALPFGPPPPPCHQKNKTIIIRTCRWKNPTCLGGNLTLPSRRVVARGDLLGNNPDQLEAKLKCLGIK